ncbi:CubicO group peptidase (beta-lactamase class C family) [Herbaspirillum rubrisubalbicans]|uniref:EstA family serine hydrolase n=1 Tax=Herbaspirillum rubrisubalbicans Os34 TaxID=1235827 RepID=A0A6M3ZUF8_9BURK|nr:EstA family serine hydrolase [Herbaspirillum rubrisubalbicans]MCP1572968.1 CubicO group peptidase (beta-lactamase class C family) [Herbaspirillum rubrisubalbicans]QJQ01530.1 EstA family serine hydrolase [Herbaspirillum rubrisubalbicans Os34]
MRNDINAEANAIVQQALDRATTEGGEIGVQVAAYLDGKLVIDAWSGYADQQSGRKVDGDTLFNVYSVTKAVAATALHILADRGLIDYDAPVVRYWPEYGAKGKQATTVRDVLTHRACVPQMPLGVTPERMCDWDWMTRAIADLEPLAEPGTKTLYLSMTFGWIVGELVRRADPKHRSLGRFVREEIAGPLGITDLWIGLPDEAVPRLARHVDAMTPVPPEYLPPLFLASMPDQVALTPRVFDRPDVRRAEVAGVGGIFNARSEARFWAMLANGGELDGVRLLSRELVASLATPRANSEEADPVMFGFPIPITIGGFWFGGAHPPVAAARHARALCHPGQGNSFGWADPETGLAVAICHNKLFNPASEAENPLRPVADAVHAALGV